MWKQIPNTNLIPQVLNINAISDPKYLKLMPNANHSSQKSRKIQYIRKKPHPGFPDFENESQILDFENEFQIIIPNPKFRKCIPNPRFWKFIPNPRFRNWISNRRSGKGIPNPSLGNVRDPGIIIKNYIKNLFADPCARAPEDGRRIKARLLFDARRTQRQSQARSRPQSEALQRLHYVRSVSVWWNRLSQFT